jgi:hypothetical protein
VGGTCGTHGRGEECVQGFDGIGIDLRETGWETVEWIQLAQDRDRWLSLVNTVMNHRILAPRI